MIHDIIFLIDLWWEWKSNCSVISFHGVKYQPWIMLECCLKGFYIKDWLNISDRIVVQY